MIAPAFPVNAEVFTVSGSCNNNLLTVEIEGVSNLELYYSNDVLLGNTLFCDRSYYADFPMPGKTVSINAHPTPAVSGELHQVEVRLDGRFDWSYDYNNDDVTCLSPPIANYQPLDDVDISTCYTESTYPFTSSSSFMTWQIVDCDVDEDRMEMTSWLSISINARESYCAGNPLECPYT